jgi:hypothetical protein
LTYATTGYIREPPLERDVCGYTRGALAVFCGTSTAIEMIATIRALASALYPEAK